MTRLGCRKPIFSFGISMLGPALHKFANEEQKMRFLTEITAGKTWWCQGYSEPNAGSDLAGLQTKAEDKETIIWLTVQRCGLPTQTKQTGFFV